MSPATQEIWRRYTEESDPEARAEILEQHLGLVHHVARGIAGRVGDAVPYEDLVSAGTLGLVQALEAFDPARGFAFTTFALNRVRGAVLDELRAADWRPRSVRTRGRAISGATASLEQRLGRRPRPEEIASELRIDLETYWQWKGGAEQGAAVPLDGSDRATEPGLPLADVLPDTSTPAPDEDIQRSERKALLRDAIAEMPEQQRIVLTLSYFEELTLRQIAEVLHVTESRISQIRTAALKSLRSRLALELAP